MIPVPSGQQRAGNFGDISDSLTGSVNGQNWANVLSQRLGYSVLPGEAYYTPGCVTSAQCVFPNATIPTRAWSAPAQNLLQYIPSPNSGNSQFSTGAFAQTVRDDKFSVRIDGNTRFGLLSGYYFFDDYKLDNPYPTQQGGANVPGFDALTLGRAQLLTFGANTVLGPNTVNELHVGYMHNANDVGKPNGGLGVSLASQGFVTGQGTPGIVVLAPELEGVENIVFNTFTTGVTITGVNQANTTLNISDNLSKVIGTHTVKVGGQFQYGQVQLEPNATFNGTFTFAGTETGSDFADFLLGVPSGYTQSQGGIFNLRNKYAGFFAQDSWRARSNLTLNYGLRWDLMAPWYEQNNQIQTVVQGQNSIVYPGAPTGLVFPTDPGVARGLSPARLFNFSPRLGVAYAPDDKTSLRASFGVFRTAFQGLSAGIMYGVPPYGYNYLSPAPPVFETPFITAADGSDNGQRFPLPAPPLNASASNPYTLKNWPLFLPVNADPFFGTNNEIPYSENYMISFQRELAHGMVATVSYVGSRGHNNVVIRQANPGDPALCLSVSDPSQVAPGSPTCGPFAENGVFTTRDGQVINGTRGPLGPNYGSMTAQETVGYSRYNALEMNLRYSTTAATVMVGYTYGKSVDNASNLGEQINPFDPSATEAPSAFDLRHNFVVSYSYDLPLARVFGRTNVLTERLGDFRNDPVQLGIPRNALQQHGHVAPRHVRQRGQQQPARHAELHTRLQSERQQRSQERRGLQHVLLQPAGAGPARHRPAPVLLRTWHQQHGPERAQDGQLRRIPVPAATRGGVQRLQSSAVLRPGRCRRQHRQQHLRPDCERGSAAADSARREVRVLSQFPNRIDQERHDVDRVGRVRNRRGRHHQPGAGRAERRLGPGGKQRMHRDADGRRQTGAHERTHGFDHRACRRDNVVDDDRRAIAMSRNVWRGHVDDAVGMAHLAKNQIGRLREGGHRRHPLFAFLVRPHENRTVHVRGNPRGQRGRGVHHATRHGVDLGQRMVPVQVRIDGHEPVDVLREEPTDRPRRDGFASLELPVLSHVGQIRRDQAHSNSAHGARGIGHKQQGQHLVVGMRERAGEQHALSGAVRLDPEVRFAVGKSPRMHSADRCLNERADSFGEGLVAFEREDEGAHERSPTETIFAWDAR